MKIIIFLHQFSFFGFFSQIKTDGNDTLLLSVPNTGVFKTLATTSYASLVYYVLHVTSTRINEAKYVVISHVACNYTCIKTQQL